MKKYSLTYLRRTADLLKLADDCVSVERREKMAHDWRVLDILRRYESYRRGSGDISDCPSPKDISWALEEVIREYKRRFNDELIFERDTEQKMF